MEKKHREQQGHGKPGPLMDLNRVERPDQFPRASQGCQESTECPCVSGWQGCGAVTPHPSPPGPRSAWSIHREMPLWTFPDSIPLFLFPLFLVWSFSQPSIVHSKKFQGGEKYFTWAQNEFSFFFPSSCLSSSLTTYPEVPSPSARSQISLNSFFFFSLPA